MADKFMTESFWAEEAGWTESMTLRDAWNFAVSRLEQHLVARNLRQPDEAPAAAREFLENATECMLRYNPGMAKQNAVAQMADTYGSSQDIEWTMSLHGLLCAKAATGATNPARAPAP